LEDGGDYQLVAESGLDTLYNFLARVLLLLLLLLLTSVDHVDEWGLWRGVGCSHAVLLLVVGVE